VFSDMTLDRCCNRLSCEFELNSELAEDLKRDKPLLNGDHYRFRARIGVQFTQD